MRELLACEALLARYDAVYESEVMRRVNPRYLLRNHLAQAAIEDAQRGSSTELHRLLTVLARPFDEQEGAGHYAAPQREGTELEVGCSA